MPMEKTGGFGKLDTGQRIALIQEPSRGEYRSMKIDTWELERIVPYARNARKIPDSAIDKVAASIKEFGWRKPIVVDAEGVIIVGHVRLQAARKLGLSDVPVHIADNLTPGQVKAYRLMDNRSHEEAEWDLELLGPELNDLLGLEFDLSLTGFDEDELTSFQDDEDGDGADAEAIPEEPIVPVSALGDVWIMGDHRIICAIVRTRRSSPRS